MGKPVPLEYGQYYHIYNRGINRERIFVEERNYRHFLRLYASHVGPVVDTVAYCLLPNHFHFLVRIKELPGSRTDLKRPSQCFSNLFNAYAKAFNKAYERTGGLFQRPFGRIVVTTDAYFCQLVIYIHQNAEKHGVVDDFGAWPFSSYHAHLSDKATRLAREEVLAWFDGAEGFERAHRLEPDAGLVAPLVGDDFG
jgi:putative transposase